MPVVFSTTTSHRVIMFDKDAAFMLKAMKTSGNIPGALFAEALPDALDALKTRLQVESDENDDTQSADDSDYVNVNTKALPLLELLQRAIEQNEKLLWDKG